METKKYENTIHKLRCILCIEMEIWKIERVASKQQQQQQSMYAREIGGKKHVHVYVQVRWLRKVCAFFMFKVAIQLKDARRYETDIEYDKYIRRLKVRKWIKVSDRARVRERDRAVECMTNKTKISSSDREAAQFWHIGHT